MASRKKPKVMPSPEKMKSLILNAQEPILLKNYLSWRLLSWTAKDWTEKLGNEKLGVRIGTRRCTKVSQWESDCEVITASLSEVFDSGFEEASDTWMYFDYKHLNHHFKDNVDLMQSVSWADFGFADKGVEDSTIWIGTKGAHTPCHMDSYGCNIIAQVYGRKLWVMFPPSKSRLMKPTRVPYEESSIYSGIHLTCGLNVNSDLEGARVVELSAGDVLVVPRHWWHYVENLTTAVSINMWIPLDSDDASRLDEALVRFFVSSMIKTTNKVGASHLLNPNEMDLLEEPVDLQQISWCLDRAIRRKESSRDIISCLPTSDNTSESAVSSVSAVPPVSTVPTMSAVPSISADELQRLLLTKCGCNNRDSINPQTLPQQLNLEQLINAFCHPDVIAQVSQILLLTKS